MQNTIVTILGKEDDKLENCSGSEQNDVIQPEKGCEVYVTRIPRDIQDKDLFSVFGRVGKVSDLRLMMEPTGINRGYAYIRYQSAKEAKEAIKQLNNYEIQPNRYLVVTKSVDNRRLWVNGIPKSKSTQEIRKEMERLTVGVTDIILYPSQADKTKSRGYMFVEYGSHKAAAMARRKLTQGTVCICGQELGQVDWAEPEHEVDEETMSNVRILFLRNLMMSTTEDTIRILFNRKGNNDVERVKKTKDFAFVHFASRKSAEKALASCENLKIDGASVEVLWSKPVDKKLYNTRKTLTKAFTMGSEIMDGESGTVQALEPRKRGAAGIRGLGAPGTAPSKQLVQRYCSLTAGVNNAVPNITAVPTNYAYFRSAPDILTDICMTNRWGEPLYTLSVTQTSTDGSIKMYLYKVTIPSFPFPAPHNVFQSYNLKPSLEEAKLEAAQFVLACLRISQEYMCTYTQTNVPQVYPMSATTLQGVPLIAPPTTLAGGAPPAGVRLVYPDPYSTAYANIINNMCAMNVTG